MSSPIIEAFLIDDDNEDKFASHGLSWNQVVQILEGEHLIARNRRNRRASHLIIGRDLGGQCIAVPIEPTHDRGVWRPVTAWPCKQSEEARLRRR